MLVHPSRNLILPFQPPAGYFGLFIPSAGLIISCKHLVKMKSHVIRMEIYSGNTSFSYDQRRTGREDIIIFHNHISNVVHIYTVIYAKSLVKVSPVKISL